MTTEATAPEVPPSPQPQPEVEGFNLLDVVLIVTTRWRLILTLGIICALAGLGVSLSMKPEYTSTVTFVAEADNNSTGAIFIIQRNDPTLAMLQSDAVADLVINRSNYAALLGGEVTPTAPQARQKFLRNAIRAGTSSSKSTDGVYTLKKVDSDPNRAQKVANAYLDGLQDLGDRMTSESAARSRAFYARQMEEEKAALEKAEAALKAGQQRTGILAPVMGRLEAQRAQLQALQMQRAEQAASSTDENPEMVRLDAQIATLRSQIATMQGSPNSRGQDTPTENLELLRLERDVRYHEALYSSYAAQFERAHLQETFGITRIHVIDRATLPAERTGPRRKVITLFAGILGLFFGLVFIAVQRINKKLLRDPGSARRLREIRASLKLRSSGR